jgi:hypothetical protein
LNLSAAVKKITPGTHLIPKISESGSNLIDSDTAAGNDTFNFSLMTYENFYSFKNSQLAAE